MTPLTNSGMINKPANHSVEETVGKLKSILQAKGVTLFALIDYESHPTIQTFQIVINTLADKC